VSGERKERGAELSVFSPILKIGEGEKKKIFPHLASKPIIAAGGSLGARNS